MRIITLIDDAAVIEPILNACAANSPRDQVAHDGEAVFAAPHRRPQHAQVNLALSRFTRRDRDSLYLDFGDG
jgi:hypothetical protein